MEKNQKLFEDVYDELIARIDEGNSHMKAIYFNV